MFGGIPDESGYRLPFAPHHLMQNGLNRSMDPYAPRMPLPPSPSLTAQRLLREQQVCILSLLLILDLESVNDCNYNDCVQDDEYLASLQADQEKELKAKEEAEAALAEERQKEEELRRKLDEEQVNFFNIVILEGI